jgi:hypothetical protein
MPARKPTREQWLLDAAAVIKKSIFATPLRKGLGSWPKKLRISCGFPSRRGASAKKMVIGQAWSPPASEDGSWQIFINPVLISREDVLATLVHEIVHCCLPLGSGHGPKFRALAVAVGLEGKMTATSASPALAKTLKGLKLPTKKYPHSKLSAARPEGAPKKQGTRMLKVFCPDCGWTCRATAKWISEGLPTCHCGAQMEADVPPEEPDATEPPPAPRKPQTSTESTRERLASVVLSYGMGVDSTAILLRWLREPETCPCSLDELVIIIAMVGDEPDDTRVLVESHVLPLLREHGIRLVQVARDAHRHMVLLDDSTAPARLHYEGAYRLSDEMEAAGTIPFQCSRSCSQHAKGEPLDAWLKGEFKGAKFTHVIGFNAEEEKRANRDEGYTTDKKIARSPSYPLIDWGWDRDECEQYIEQAVGEPWAKSCCSYCPFTDGRTEHMTRLEAQPDLTAEALMMEYRARALNAKALLYQHHSLVTRCQAEGHEEALSIWQSTLAVTDWTLYRVSRVWKHWTSTSKKTGLPTEGWNAARRVQHLVVGTRDECEAALRSLAGDADVQEEDGLVRVVLAQREPKTEGKDDMLAVGPAGAVAKVNISFDKWADEQGLVFAGLADEPDVWTCPFCGEEIDADFLGLDMMGPLADWQACCYDLQEEVARDGFEAVMGVSAEAVLEQAFGLPVREVTLEGDSLALCTLQGVDPGPGVKGWQAQVFDAVDEHHRHHTAPAGWKFGVAVDNGHERVGVAVVGRPVSREIQAREPGTLEVTRVCTWGPAPLRHNAATKLYGLAGRRAKRGGYDKLITYTLADVESGTSLRAAGFEPDHRTAGGSWDCATRPRQDKAPTGQKIRWVRYLTKKARKAAQRSAALEKAA